MADNNANDPYHDCSTDPESNQHTCSSFFGRWHQHILMKMARKANEARLIAADFLVAREPVEPLPPQERKPFAEWAKKHGA